MHPVNSICSLSEKLSEKVLLVVHLLPKQTELIKFTVMKAKLFLLVLIGYITMIPVMADKPVTDKAAETKYWHFLKERLFDGERPIVASFQENMYFQLQVYSKQDSLIVNNLISELHQLIPDRIIKLYEPTKGTINEPYELITLGTNNGIKFLGKTNLNSTPIINGNQILYSGFKGVYQPEIFWQQIIITFNRDVTFSKRKQYIEYAVIRSLCNIKGKRKEAQTFVEGAILNSFDYNPENTSFSDVDKFLITKLYSKDFQKQFRNFMLENYPLRYYLVFTHKDTMTLIGYTVSIILILIILLLSFKPIFVKEYKQRYFNYLLPALVVASSVILIVVTFHFLTTMAIMLNISYLIMLMILNIFAAIVATLLYFIEKITITPGQKISVQILTKSLLLLLIYLIIPIIFFNIYDLDGLTYMYVIYFVISGVALTIGRGMILYFKHIQKSLLLAKDAEINKVKELKTRAEMEALHARINPHFLYNSLNSIAGLAGEDPEKTKEMALALSDMFRYTINRSNELMSSVKDEVKMARTYLEIEQIRFGERMHFTIDVDSEAEEHKIPKFVLLPLVENAVKHGISKTEGEGHISLTIVKTTGGIEIKVTDNGPDFPDGLINGYGLQSINDLLKLNYGKNTEMFWQNRPEKLICIKIG